MVLGLFDGDDVVEHWRIATDPRRTADELAVVFRSLLAGSASRPEVEGIAVCSTVPAVRSGIVFGFAGQVDGIVERMARELADDPDDVTVIATGGLAPLVLAESATIDVHEPWLTLHGLRLAFARNV